MRRARLVFLGLFMSMAGFACGDSDSDGDGPMCGGVQTCGGKLEGSWKLDDACYIVLEQPDLDFCPTAVAELHARMSDGNVTFEKDTYERHVELQTELLLKLPAKCQEQKDSTEKKACTAFGAKLSNGASLVCADADAGGCECSATLKSTLNDSGPFSIHGNRVELVGEQLDYCVSGKTLTLRPTESINMSGTPVTSQLQTTFQKN